MIPAPDDQFRNILSVNLGEGGGGTPKRDSGGSGQQSQTQNYFWNSASLLGKNETNAKQQVIANQTTRGILAMKLAK